MSTKHLLDPELLPLLEAIPTSVVFNAEMLPAFREQQAAMAVLSDPAPSGVTRTEVLAPVNDGTEVRCLLYVPDNAPSPRAGYVHIHGGGYIIGTANASDANNIALASALGIVVISVDYRLAPEHPIPAPLEDCYAALAWLHENAGDLGIDRERVAIGGESAGGGLAAALAILARDRGDYAVCHQHLTYPMLDNLTGSDEQPGDPLVGEFVWTRERNQYGWQAYLGDAPAEAPQVPARVADFADLPPAWIHTVTLDLFRDENIAYATGLLRAGVPVELHVWPGGCHAFQMMAESRLAKRFASEHQSALALALGVEASS